MQVVQKSLTLGNYAFTTVAICVALVAVWAWVQALLAWGSAGLFASALTWSFLTLVAFLPVIAIEWVQGRWG